MINLNPVAFFHPARFGQPDTRPQHGDFVYELIRGDWAKPDQARAIKAQGGPHARRATASPFRRHDP